MAADIRVMVPTCDYDFHDRNAPEHLGGHWEARLSDGTRVLLYPRSIAAIAKFYEENKEEIDKASEQSG